MDLEYCLLASSFELHHKSGHPVLGEGSHVQSLGHFLLNLLFSEDVLHITHIHEGLFVCDPCCLLFVGVVLET